ncbi:MAG: hypothetical protein IJ008_01060 [Clostridia bacterium]|nr:hypothetical protein [Clostridia bacterium]
MKKDKTYYGFLFTIVVLFILLGISIYLGMSGWFYSISSTDADIDLMLGKKVVVAVEPNQTSAVSFGLKGEYIPHEKLTQTIKINAENLNKDVYIRVKGFLFNSQNNISEIEFETTENWIYDDGYYYFTDLLKGGNNITFSSNVIVPDNVVLRSDKSYLVTVVVEALDTSFDSELIWGKILI